MSNAPLQIMDPPLGRKQVLTASSHLRSRQNKITYNDSTQAKQIAAAQHLLQNYYQMKYEPPKPVVSHETKDTGQVKWFSFLSEKTLDEITEEYTKH